MTRALNKNKKPEINNKNRACNYFLGSFGSPCSFYDLPPNSAVFSALSLRLTAHICCLLHHPSTKC
ncbi:hypothetical protein EAH78_21850 [Pseudomonas arsenicoxydans]|uniref:Uncharacterized protein n=1 Tax=Pseudomonas arsenicoxydans TaxID=702115 RepID=A0A502HJP4_9PSED|nr:hypothetical protein EAH78_21850 [Pseudomonas arsenicoxydans]